MSERIDEIRTKLRSACYEFIANGGKIVSNRTYGFTEQVCCPLGAVAINSGVNMFKIENVLSAAANIVGMAEDHIGAFVSGFDRKQSPGVTTSPPGLTSDSLEMYQLGVELRKEFIK